MNVTGATVKNAYAFCLNLDSITVEAAIVKMPEAEHCAEVLIAIDGQRAEMTFEEMKARLFNPIKERP